MTCLSVGKRHRVRDIVLIMIKGRTGSCSNKVTAILNPKTNNNREKMQLTNKVINS